MIISVGPDIDQLCYEFRQAELTWDRVARTVGLGSASSARTAAARHARRIGGNLGYVPSGSGRGQRRQGLRKFGVEIEFVEARRIDVVRQLERAFGEHVHLTDYHGRTCELCGNRIRGFTQWKVERDGSVSDGSYGGEVVTPVLAGPDGLEKLRKAMAAVREADGEVNARCGMHVHLSVEHMTNGQRAKLVERFYQHHDTFDRFVARSRTVRGRGQGYVNYCPRAEESEYMAQAENMRHRGNFGYAEKYRSLNLQPFAKYGTVEVRMHQGTLNGRKAGAWVQLLVGFLDAVQHEQDDSLAPGLALLGSLVDADRISQSTASYLMNRAEQLA